MGFALTEMQVTSSAFGPGGAIPAQHTGDGADTSPALAWSNPPDGTQAYAVVCHDPDAPLLKPDAYGFVHWVCYNIPGSVTALEEGASGYSAGQNDFGNSGYGGPMPPPGHGRHHYFFWVLALDKALELPEGLSMLELFAKIEPHVIGMNRLVGTYEKS